MKKLAIVLLLLAGPALACQAFLKDEFTDGFNKICLYDHLGSDYAITVGAQDFCPTTVEVAHE